MIKSPFAFALGACFCGILFLLPFCQAFGAARLAAETPQSVRGTVNGGGPENWPESEGFSTAADSRAMPEPASPAAPEAPARPVMGEVPGAPEPFPAPAVQPLQPGGQVQPPEALQPVQAPRPTGQVQPVQQSPVRERPLAPQAPRQAGRQMSGSPASGNVGLPLGASTEPAPAPPPREVIYVDEQGNPVAKPPEPEKMLAEASELMDQGKFDDALAIYRNAREIPHLPRKLLEQALYGISDCLWARYADNPLAGYEPIISATNEALNANLRSPRVPDALLRLGLANVNVGNLEDARGYVTALRRRFPDYPGVAQGLTALGQAQLKKGRDAEAEKTFNVVLDKYPESSQLQDASVGLAHALVNQKKDERARTILDFISKRWPRYYINDPDFLLMHAANEERVKGAMDAMDLYWLYINLDPKRKGNDKLLLKMGDAYMKAANTDAANFIYEEIDRDFHETAAAQTARMRLAEKGIHDAPISYEEMEKVFALGRDEPISRMYEELINFSDTNPDSVLARLKQAMWLYWDKQYPEAMGKSADFIDSYPEHSQTDKARDIIWNAFKEELDQSLAERNYGRILLLWNGFPLVRERYGKMDAPLRYALAQGWLERGEEAKAYGLLSEFLKGPMDPDFGEAAFSQFFNHYLQNGAWDKILDLGKLVADWKLKPELKNQLEYAMALSAQNLNLGTPALEMWRRLARQDDIPLYQRAYATYFLAKDAERRRDIRNAYEDNRKVVEMFTRLADERSDKADPARIKEAIASLMDICEVGERVPEALEWLKRYSVYAPENSPEYPGLRFREARLYRKLGDNARAQSLLEQISTKFPDSPFAQPAAAELRTFDVSRDLQRYMSDAPASQPQAGEGSTSGNWSSSGPTAKKQ